MKNQFLEISAVSSDPVDKPLKVLLLADDEHPANTIIDYIESIVSESCHDIHLINPINSQCPENLSKREYDAIIIHCSITITESYYLSPKWVKGITHFDGIKVQIVQDEYRWINKMKAQMRCLGVQAIFSSLSKENAEMVYGGEFMSDTKVLSCLPGYFSKRLRALPFRPFKEREYDVIYRGRELPWSTGKFAQAKKKIGQNFISWSKDSDLRSDIQTKESERIYGDDWDTFLMSGKTMLGVEGGASIFDFDGTLAEDLTVYESENPNADLSQYWEAKLKLFEEKISHKTITPKIFEAIATRTVLVLNPGEYTGVLKPDRHYIPLLEDGSNFKEVVKKIKDDQFLTELAETTYEEIAKRDDLTYKFFVDKVDRILHGLEKNPSQSNAETFFRKKVTIQNIETEELINRTLDLNQTVSSLEHELISASQREEMLQAEADGLRNQIEDEQQFYKASLENELQSASQREEMLQAETDALQRQIQVFKNLLQVLQIQFQKAMEQTSIIHRWVKVVKKIRNRTS
ncbi:MAG: hypothetical protein P8J01_01875 [Acidimicrobiales bacterium]|nr:hypothetical protein [Acidimicrobiales bacterium]